MDWVQVQGQGHSYGIGFRSNVRVIIWIGFMSKVRILLEIGFRFKVRIILGIGFRSKVRVSSVHRGGGQ